MKLKIMTNQGNRLYTIDHQTGNVNGFSNWIFNGLYDIKKKGVFIPLEDIDDKKLVELGLTNQIFLDRYNKCRYGVMDIDNGTSRMWGETICRIWIEN